MKLYNPLTRLKDIAERVTTFEVVLDSLLSLLLKKNVVTQDEIQKEIIELTTPTTATDSTKGKDKTNA